MPDNSATITLIGGPTVLIEVAGFKLLTDPTFDPPGSYATLQKTAGPALSAETLGAIDAVLLSHDQHADNLDHLGRETLTHATHTFTTVVAAGRVGGGAIGMSNWETRTIEKPDGGRLFITATPARHGPPGIEPMMGDVSGFLVGLKEAGDFLYFSGDTVWYEGVAEIARRYRPRVIVLCVGSAQSRGAFHLTMDANDALEAAVAFGDAKVIGVHNHGWAHFKESPEELQHAFNALGRGEQFIPLALGGSVAIPLTP